MEPSIFTRIIKGELPCHKVYEDDRVFAFLDIHPITRGHVLAVSKVQIDEFQDLDEADYTALMNAVKKIAMRQKDVLGVSRVGLQVIGVDIPHAHVHVIPFETIEQFRNVPDMAAEPDHDALAEVASKLAF